MQAVSGDIPVVYQYTTENLGFFIIYSPVSAFDLYKILKINSIEVGNL